MRPEQFSSGNPVPARVAPYGEFPSFNEAGAIQLAGNLGDADVYLWATLAVSMRPEQFSSGNQRLETAEAHPLTGLQ